MFKFISMLFLSWFVSSVWAQPNLHHHRSYQHHYSPLTYALRIGMDTNGNALYLCRAKLFNSIQPGKTWAGYGHCNVAYGGKEYVLSKFTIPKQREFGNYNWERKKNNPIVIGKDTNGRLLYLCQSNFKGSIQPGKTWAGYNHCNISYAGQEIITDYYHVLSSGNTIVVQAGPRPNVHFH